MNSITNLVLPLEVITQEIFPRLLLNDLLSFLTTNKYVYTRVISSIRWLDWFEGSDVITKLDKRETKIAFMQWAYRGIALEELSNLLPLLFLYMDDDTVDYVCLYIRLYHPHAAIYNIPGKIKSLYTGQRNGVYSFGIHNRAIEYVRNFVHNINIQGVREAFPTDRKDCILFGDYISRFIRRWWGYNWTPTQVLSEYIVSSLSTKDCIEIISTNEYNQSPAFRLQRCIADELYMRHTKIKNLSSIELNIVLGHRELDCKPFNRFGVSKSNMKSILKAGGLYCERKCCEHRPPNRSMLNLIYKSSPHTYLISYNDWLELCINILNPSGR